VLFASPASIDGALAVSLVTALAFLSLAHDASRRRGYRPPAPVLRAGGALTKTFRSLTFSSSRSRHQHSPVPSRVPASVHAGPRTRVPFTVSPRRPLHAPLLRERTRTAENAWFRIESSYARRARAFARHVLRKDFTLRSCAPVYLRSTALRVSIPRIRERDFPWARSPQRGVALRPTPFARPEMRPIETCYPNTRLTSTCTSWVPSRSELAPGLARPHSP